MGFVSARLSSHSSARGTLRVLARRKRALTCLSSRRRLCPPTRLICWTMKKTKASVIFLYFNLRQKSIYHVKNMPWSEYNRCLPLSVSDFIVLIDENVIMRFRQICRIFHFRLNTTSAKIDSDLSIARLSSVKWRGTSKTPKIILTFSPHLTSSYERQLNSRGCQFYVLAKRRWALI